MSSQEPALKKNKTKQKNWRYRATSPRSILYLPVFHLVPPSVSHYFAVTDNRCLFLHPQVLIYLTVHKIMAHLDVPLSQPLLWAVCSLSLTWRCHNKRNCLLVWLLLCERKHLLDKSFVRLVDTCYFFPKCRDGSRFLCVCSLLLRIIVTHRYESIISSR